MGLRPLPESLQKKAEEELNELTSRTSEDLQHVREWLEKHPHLNARTDDQWLISFLRGSKFSLQRAKDRIDYFYTVKNRIPEMFSNRDPFLPVIQEMLNAGCIVPLSKSSDELSPRVIYINSSVCNYDTMSLEAVVKLYLMILNILLVEDDSFMVSGVHLWIDYKGVNLNYVKQYTPSFINKANICMQHAYPVRIKGFYCTNVPAIFESIFSFVKTLLRGKLRERMFVFSEDNFTELAKYIPKEIQPIEVGGEGNSLTELAAHWKKKVESYTEWFMEDEKYIVDEAKRIGPSQAGDAFGTEGSFRKLDID